MVCLRRRVRRSSAKDDRDLFELPKVVRLRNGQVNHRLSEDPRDLNVFQPIAYTMKNNWTAPPREIQIGLRLAW